MSTYVDFVSTERCVELTGLSKYEVSVLIARRSRELSSGSAPLVPRNNRKNISLALAELASGVLDIEELDARLLHSLRVAQTSKDERDGTKQAAPFEPDDLLKELKRSMFNEAAAAESSTGSGSVLPEEPLDGEDKSSISYADEEIVRHDDDSQP